MKNDVGGVLQYAPYSLFMNKNAKIFIVGHDDIIENSLYQYFQSNHYPYAVSASAIGLNPAIQSSVYEYFQKHRPEYIFLGSTRAGGIHANQQKGGEFAYHNLESQNNILYAAQKFGIKKLLFLGASCVYPKECPQPMREEYLLTGELEKTSEPYAVAKIAGIKLCQAFRRQYGFDGIAAVPATVYGPGSDMNMDTAHVVGALITKFAGAVRNKAKEVIVWGSGRPRREFLYKDDFIEAACFLMERYDEEQIINIGCGYDVTIKELAEMIREVSGFEGKIVFDETKPEGTKQKLLDNSRLTKLGWKAKVSLREGLERTYAWYKSR